MSYTELIKETLNILDLNVTFEENCLRKEKINGQICKVYTGKLTYSPDSCEHCKSHSTIIRWGMTTVRLLLNEVAEFKTYLELKKQRFKCHACQQTFVADTSIAEKHCFISQSVKWAITTRLKENTSMTGIARQKNVSVSSVYRVLKRFYQPMNPFKTTLPTVLHFDEVKSVRQVSGAMSFIILNGQTRKLFDIVENRQLPYLERYFNRFPLSVRENVQFIVIDMYAPYVSLVKKCFPKAKLIIDRFHIVQHIGRTFRNHRITWTNRLLKSSSLAEKRQGKQLKKYWKVLQKNQEKLDSLNRRWRPSFKTYLTETELVDRLLSYSVELTQGYTLYQDFLYAVHKRNQTYFDALLTQNVSHLPATYQTTIRTFKKYQKQIHHALNYSYSNGKLECLNNHIKVLKRNAYGFRNFYNFKLRIFIQQGQAIQTK